MTILSLNNVSNSIIFQLFMKYQTILYYLLYVKKPIQFPSIRYNRLFIKFCPQRPFSSKRGASNLIYYVARVHDITNNQSFPRFINFKWSSKLKNLVIYIMVFNLMWYIYISEPELVSGYSVKYIGHSHFTYYWEAL